MKNDVIKEKIEKYVTFSILISTEVEILADFGLLFIYLTRVAKRIFGPQGKRKLGPPLLQFCLYCQPHHRLSCGLTKLMGPGAPPRLTPASQWACI